MLGLCRRGRRRHRRLLRPHDLREFLVPPHAVLLAPEGGFHTVIDSLTFAFQGQTQQLPRDWVQGL